MKIPFTNVYLGKEAKEMRSLVYGSWELNQFRQITGGKISFNVLYDLYNDVVDIKRSVGKIQDTTAQAGYALLNAKNEDLDPDFSEVKIFNSIMSNSKTTFRNFIRDWILDLCVAGNSFWLIVRNDLGNPLWIERLDPRTMSLVSNENGDTLAYVQRTNYGTPQVFKPEDVIHSFMDRSTKNAMLGISPIESVVWQAQTEIQAQKSNWYFYYNNSVPSHLLIVEETLSADQFEKLKSEVERNYKGTENRFKAGIIPFVKDIKTITPSQKDMQYIATRQANTEKIVVAFGVDKFLLGYTDGVQRGNAQEIRDAFYNDTVRNYEVLLEEIINTNVFPKLGLVKIKFKINKSDFRSEDVIANRTRLDVQAGIITINEAREARNLPYSDNILADELMINGLTLNDLSFSQQEVLASYKNTLDKRAKDLDKKIKENENLLR